MIHSLFRRLTLAAVLIVPPALVGAHNGATGIVGERMMAMMMLSDQVNALVPAVESGSMTQSQVDNAARMILMHAGPAMTQLFPEGSADGPSEALPAIWERWDDFTAYADRLAELGRQLQQAQVYRPDIDPVMTASVPEKSEWERISFASLIGRDRNPLVAQAKSQTGSAARGPDVGEVVRAITQTCSACHTDFRR